MKLENVISPQRDNNKLGNTNAMYENRPQLYWLFINCFLVSDSMFEIAKSHF